MSISTTLAPDNGATVESSWLILNPGESVTYSMTWVAGATQNLYFQKSTAPGTIWENIITPLLAVSDGTQDITATTYINESPNPEYLRWASVETNGASTDEQATVTITEVTGDPEHVFKDGNGVDRLVITDEGIEVTGNVTQSGVTSGVGTVGGTNITVAESGDVVHKTVFTFTAESFTLTDDATVGQWATIKLYDFPAGNIYVLGATIDLDLTLTAPFIDTAEGDVALGSAPSTDATALTGTLGDFLSSTAIAALTAKAGPIHAQSVTANNIAAAAAGGTDTDLNLNILIDDNAAHATTAGQLISGTITVLWANLGDF